MVKRSPSYRKNPVVTEDAGFEKALRDFPKLTIVLLTGEPGKNGKVRLLDKSTPLYLKEGLDKKILAWFKTEPKLGDIKSFKAKLTNGDNIEVIVAYALEKFRAPFTTISTVTDVMIALKDSEGKSFFISTQGLTAEDKGNITNAASRHFAASPKTIIISKPATISQDFAILKKDAELAKKQEVMYLRKIKETGKPLYIKETLGNPFISANPAVITLYYREGDAEFDPAFIEAQNFFGYQNFWDLVYFWANPPEGNEYEYNEVYEHRGIDFFIETKNKRLSQGYLQPAPHGTTLELEKDDKLVFIVMDDVGAVIDPETGEAEAEDQEIKAYYRRLKEASSFVATRAEDYPEYSLYFIKENLSRTPFGKALESYVYKLKPSVPVYVVGLRGRLMGDGSPVILADAPVTLGVNYKTDLGKLSLVEVGPEKEDQYEDLIDFALDLKRKMLTEGQIARPIVFLQAIDDCIDGWKVSLKPTPTKEKQRGEKSAAESVLASKQNVRTGNYSPFDYMKKKTPRGSDQPTPQELQWIFRLVPAKIIEAYYELGRYFVQGKKLVDVGISVVDTKDEEIIHRIASSDLYLSMNEWRNASKLFLRQAEDTQRAQEDALMEIEEQIAELDIGKIEIDEDEDIPKRQKEKLKKEISSKIKALKKQKVIVEERIKKLRKELRRLKNNRDWTALTMGNYFMAPLLEKVAPTRGLFGEKIDVKPMNMSVVSVVARDCAQEPSKGVYPLDVNSLDTAIQKYATEMAIRTGPIVVFDSELNGVTSDNWPQIKVALEALARVGCDVYAVNVPDAIPKPEVELPPDYRQVATGALAQNYKLVKVSERTSPVQWIVFIGKGDARKDVVLYKENDDVLEWWETPKFQDKIDPDSIKGLERIFPGGVQMKNMILNGFVNNREWTRQQGFDNTLLEWQTFLQAQSLKSARPLKQSEGDLSTFDKKKREEGERRVERAQDLRDQTQKIVEKSYVSLNKAIDKLTREIRDKRFQRLDLLISIAGIRPAQDIQNLGNAVVDAEEEVNKLIEYFNLKAGSNIPVRQTLYEVQIAFYQNLIRRLQRLKKDASYFIAVKEDIPLDWVDAWELGMNALYTALNATKENLKIARLELKKLDKQEDRMPSEALVPTVADVKGAMPYPYAYAIFENGAAAALSFHDPKKVWGKEWAYQDINDPLDDFWCRIDAHLQEEDKDHVIVHEHLRYKADTEQAGRQKLAAALRRTGRVGLADEILSSWPMTKAKKPNGKLENTLKRIENFKTKHRGKGWLSYMTNECIKRGIKTTGHSRWLGEDGRYYDPNMVTPDDSDFTDKDGKPYKSKTEGFVMVGGNKVRVTKANYDFGKNDWMIDVAIQRGSGPVEQQRMPLKEYRKLKKQRMVGEQRELLAAKGQDRWSELVDCFASESFDYSRIKEAMGEHNVMRMLPAVRKPKGLKYGEAQTFREGITIRGQKVAPGDRPLYVPPSPVAKEVLKMAEAKWWKRERERIKAEQPEFVRLPTASFFQADQDITNDINSRLIALQSVFQQWDAYRFVFQWNGQYMNWDVRVDRPPGLRMPLVTDSSTKMPAKNLQDVMRIASEKWAKVLAYAVGDKPTKRKKVGTTAEGKPIYEYTFAPETIATYKRFFTTGYTQRQKKQLSGAEAYKKQENYPKNVLESLAQQILLYRKELGYS